MIIKKIFIILLTSILLINTSFSYELNSRDKNILNKIYLKIDNFSENKKNILDKKIKILIKKYKKNERLNFLLINIDKYILNSFETKNQIIKINNNLEKNISINKFKVLKVIDGDTIKINYFWKKENIRFIWIDAPENSKIRKWYIECYWKESKEFLYNLLNNKKVDLEFDKTQWKRDKYDRLLAYVILDWKNVNNLIIKNGFAFEYTYNKPYKYLNLFKKSQEIAKKNKLWVWSLKTCKLKLNKVFNKKINHKKYTKKQKKFNKKIQKNIDWKCNIKWNISYKTKKKLYHLPTCIWYKRTKINLDKWEKWFCSEREAINAWWVKAGNCK